MRRFVENDFRIQVAVASWRRPVEHVHLYAGRFTIGTRSKIGVVEAGPVLRVGQHRIIPSSATAKIVFLIIPGAFIETELIKLVVHPIAPIEQLHDGSVAVGVG